MNPGRIHAHSWLRTIADLVLVSIAGADDADLSFSADTGMGECLVVGRKSNIGSTRATFVVLNERPAYPLIGASAAEQIRRLIAGAKIRRLEDGPVGGTPIRFGDDVIGQALDAPLPASGGWNLARIADLALAQTAYQMVSEQRVWLPGANETDSSNISITTVAAIGEIGPVHRDINGNTPTGGARGPFDISPVKPGSVPTYPVLWSHDAESERTMSFDADCEGIPRRGLTAEEQAALDVKSGSDLEHRFPLSLQLRFPVQQPVHGDAIHASQNHWRAGVAVHSACICGTRKSTGSVGQHVTWVVVALVAFQQATIWQGQVSASRHFRRSPSWMLRRSPLSSLTRP